MPRVCQQRCGRGCRGRCTEAFVEGRVTAMGGGRLRREYLGKEQGEKRVQWQRLGAEIPGTAR
jgi:hypothetical protein